MSALVMDAQGNHALAAVRSLSRHGIHVTAADCVPWAKSFLSRYCHRRALYPSPATGVTGFLQGLSRVLDRSRPDVLMPMTERTILAIIARRAQIEAQGTRVPLPSDRALAVAFDKQTTLELAESCRVPVPRTIRLSGPDDLGSVRSQLPYPVVIKPRQSEIWTADDRIVPSGSVEYCFAPDDLEARYRAVHHRAPLPLIQEFIPGEGYGISVLYAHGRLKALFAHRRLRMIRATGAASSLRESISPPPDMVEATRALLDALGWHGVAMVEFKRDARDRRPVLMEINGRFWNSLPLAVAAGVDFPFLLYRLAVDGDVRECFTYATGVKSRWLIGDLRHLIEVLRGRPRGWSDRFPTRGEALLDLLRSFNRDMHYDELWAGDPLPFIGDILDLFLQITLSLRRRYGRPVVEKLPREAATEAR